MLSASHRYIYIHTRTHTGSSSHTHSRVLLSKSQTTLSHANENIHSTSKQTTMNKLILLIALSALTCTYVNGECANACSGHGFCGEYDMCMCNRNYRGADCSERVCPYGHAFVTTPQGDINSDGDRADNTWKRLSVPVKELKINSDTITLEGELKQTTEEIGATNMHRHEVGPGDMIRIGNQVMQVTECRDSTAQGDKSSDAKGIAYNPT